MNLPRLLPHGVHLSDLAGTTLRDLAAVLAVIGVASAASAVLRRQVRSREHRVLLDILAPDGGELVPAAWPAFFRGLFGMARPWWKRWLLGQPSMAFEYASADGAIRTRCVCPESLRPLLNNLLRTALPGVEIVEAGYATTPKDNVARARLRLFREPVYPLGQPKTEVLRGVLGALAEASGGGIYQLSVEPDVGWQGRAMRRLDRLAGVTKQPNLLAAVIDELLDIVAGPILRKTAPPPTTQSSPARALPPPDKASEPGYRVEARLLVAGASGAEAKRAMQALTSAFRTLDGENALRPARILNRKRFDGDLGLRRPPGRGAMLLGPTELAHLFHLPCGGADMEMAPVRVLPRRLPPTTGQVICLAEDPRRTAIAIAQEDLRQHAHVLGSTGSGKSTELANMALDSIEAGTGACIVDPKGDLVRAVLERIPPHRRDRVFLVDPSERELPVGLNVLDCPDPDLREAVCDSVVTIFRKNYERFWGPRTDDVLRAAVLTLLHKPGLTLCEIPLLLLHPECRTELVGKLDDPIGLDAFWDEYERMGEMQRLQMVGPLLNKLRAFLLRRTVRNMLGQPVSTLDIRRIMDEGGILLVSLAKGLLGEETSRLLGSFMVARIWQAALSRAEHPEHLRPDFNLYLDEFQTYLHLPQSLDEILAEARGYRLCLTLANQHLAQLSRSTVEALAANARTRIVFQCGQDDARYLAKEFGPWMSEQHLRNLQQFQVAVRLCAGGRTQPPFTGTTRSLPESVGRGYADAIRREALRRCGRPRAEVETAIVARYRGTGMLPISPPPDDSGEDAPETPGTQTPAETQQAQQPVLRLLRPPEEAS